MNEEDMIVPDVATTDQSGETEGLLLENTAAETETTETTEAASESQDGAGKHSTESGDEGDGTEASTETAAHTTESQTDTARSEPVAAPIENPGDTFTPKGEYAFDIELSDGTTIHIATPEDISKIPADADFGSAANLMTAQSKLNKMVVGIDAEQRQWETDKASYEQQQSTHQALVASVETAQKEATYLEAKGLLPPLAPELDTVEAGRLWRTEHRNKPGVKERMDLLEYQEKENATRQQAGLPPMGLIDAMNQMRLDADIAAADTQKKQVAEARKKAGAMVGGSTHGSIPNTPDGYIVGEVIDPRSYNRL